MPLIVARALSETSGRTSSRTSPRAGEDAVVFGAFADGKVSVRTTAGVRAATGELSGRAAVFFSAAVFSEFCVADGADVFRADEVSRRTGCSIRFGVPAGCAGAAEADDEESERWPRIFGSAMMAKITNSTAATGTT